MRKDSSSALFHSPNACKSHSHSAHHTAERKCMFNQKIYLCPNSNVLVAICKGWQAVKLFRQNPHGCRPTQVDPYKLPRKCLFVCINMQKSFILLRSSQISAGVTVLQQSQHCWLTAPHRLTVLFVLLAAVRRYCRRHCAAELEVTSDCGADFEVGSKYYDEARTAMSAGWGARGSTSSWKTVLGSLILGRHAYRQISRCLSLKQRLPIVRMKCCIFRICLDVIFESFVLPRSAPLTTELSTQYFAQKTFISHPSHLCCCRNRSRSTGITLHLPCISHIHDTVFITQQ